jgi:hypothetical protein
LESGIFAALKKQLGNGVPLTASVLHTNSSDIDRRVVSIPDQWTALSNLQTNWPPIRAIFRGIGWSGDRQETSVAREVKQSAA